MHEMCSQLTSLGDDMTDTKFALVISDALPSSYDILKTLTVAMVTDVSMLASNTLVTQILQEEKWKSNQNLSTALLAKSGKTSEKPSNSKPNSPNTSKSKKGRTHPCCTNPKCPRQIGHTFEQCWAEGDGSKGKQPLKSRNSQLGSGSPSKDSGKKKDGKVDLLLAHEHAAVTDLIHSFPSEWVVDSGASSHICMNHDWFTSYSLLNPPHPILLGDKCVLHTIGQGQIEIVIHNDPDDHHAIIKDVLHCSQIGTNLLSVPHLTKLSAKVQFIDNECQILNSDDDLIGIAKLSNGLYKLPCTIMGTEKAYITKYIGDNEGNVEAVNITQMTTASASVNIWHAHLGHISIDSILKMSHSGMAKGMDIIGNKRDASTYCEECEASGHTRSIIPKETLTHSHEVLGHVFSDVCEVQMITRKGY